MSGSRVVGRRLESNDGNHGTILSVPRLTTPIDARAVFTRHWPAIRAAVNGRTRQGVVVFAFDRGAQPLGELWMEASLDRTRTAIVGRHTHCDLRLGDSHAALRQLAILVRAIDHHEARVRVIDLRSGVPFTDEAGRELEAVVADAPLFLAVHDVVLVVLRTPELGGWADDPERAYATLPERVFVDQTAARVPALRQRPEGPRGRGPRIPNSETLVRSVAGPLAMTDRLCGRDAAALGLVTVRSSGSEIRHRVDAAALDRGILIGRYDRCQIGLADAFQRLSRVHLLLVREHDQILAVDTASMNGTFHAGRPARLTALSSGDTLDLTEEVQLSWSTLA